MKDLSSANVLLYEMVGITKVFFRSLDQKDLLFEGDCDADFFVLVLCIKGALHL